MARNVRANGGEILRRAAGVGDIQCVTECLCDFHCVVDDADALGYTALHYACRDTGRHSIMAVVQYLLENGANANAQTASLATPLHLSCTGYRSTAHNHGHRVVMALLEAGADPLKRDANGLIPLHLAASWGLTGIAMALLAATATATANGNDFGPQISMSDRFGQTPIDWASDHPDTEELLFVCAGMAQPSGVLWRRGIMPKMPPFVATC